MTLKASEPSWQLTGTSPPQLGRTLPSFPLQQRQQGLLGDRSTVSMSIPQNKSILSGQPSVASAPADLPINPKATVPPSSLGSPHQSTSMSPLVFCALEVHPQACLGSHPTLQDLELL